MTYASATNRATLVRRGRRLEYLTLAWNSLEGIVALVAGIIAGSISLVGFGLDSLIEMVSGAALLWRMKVDADIHHRERNERIALRIVGACFLALAAYIAFQSLRDLWQRTTPHPSLAGIVLACAALLVMPLLARAKRKVGSGLRSAAMHADATQSSLCAYLSAILLAGLLLNAWFGLWWGDPFAALIMVPIIAREGFEALQGRPCDDCSPTGF
jgi:divalent metal cation (Fe/Co/Zn/Cd) transporter